MTARERDGYARYCPPIMAEKPRQGFILGLGSTLRDQIPHHGRQLPTILRV